MRVVELVAEEVNGRVPVLATVSETSTREALRFIDGANALGVAKAVKAKLTELAPFFPNQIHYSIGYDTTPFVRISIEEVVKTLAAAQAKLTTARAEIVRLHGESQLRLAESGQGDAAALDAARAAGHRSGENPARWRGHLDKLLPKRPKLARGRHKAMPYAEVAGFVAKLRERDDPVGGGTR